MCCAGVKLAVQITAKTKQDATAVYQVRTRAGWDDRAVGDTMPRRVPFLPSGMTVPWGKRCRAT